MQFTTVHMTVSFYLILVYVYVLFYFLLFLHAAFVRNKSIMAMVNVLRLSTMEHIVSDNIFR